ncbi:uncharacterized protein MELLADRAFT_106484 [Melampsora larici-populina 98AG31]|uniref:Uncharacterized protein n=1 Tax=Melampsora larici-populina (strain 98AG31 / pathotype 3-4-7) TaxID=747676 RepID=F4RLN1_MELLP|nr:uncharacterized protein MELLADRAFT_106484 [Melampsora larici-populina 98AG31]EGG06562.1 hypothetical protein MELLADRAFT_106484 [Melampsora larici-populina 98AG31]
MRPGLRRRRAASSPPPPSPDREPGNESDSGSEWNLPPPLTPPATVTTSTRTARPITPPITTTARQQRATQSQPQASHTQGQPKRTSRKRARPNETAIEPPILPDPDKEDDDLDINMVPTITNYRDLGRKWGTEHAQKALASLTLPKNLSPTGLYEAQALQSDYELDKTMLCLVLKCSRRVLDEALLEGPLAREPNMYTNYQTYSVVATTTTMPPKGTSVGFKERNAIVGSTWSTYNEEEHEVFTPRLFERLCVATSEAYALTKTPLGITPNLPLEQTPSTKTPASTLEPLSQDEVDKYVPVFERLVNLTKVSHDLYQARLWRHSGKSKNRSMENLMTLKISKIVRQLHVLKNQFNLQFHLLVASWNPGTSAPRALFQNEFTSCDRWARNQQKNHLLECFTFESTKAPLHLRPKRNEIKPMCEGAARQAQRRTELANALNGLIAPYLRGGYMGRGDAHPKVPNLKAAFEAKTFRGDIKLNFICTPQSRITDLMLSKGPGHLSNDEVDIWIEDIKMKNYIINRVVQAGKPDPDGIVETIDTTAGDPHSNTDLPQETMGLMSIHFTRLFTCLRGTIHTRAKFHTPSSTAVHRTTPPFTSNPLRSSATGLSSYQFRINSFEPSRLSPEVTTLESPSAQSGVSGSSCNWVERRLLHNQTSIQIATSSTRPGYPGTMSTDLDPGWEKRKRDKFPIGSNESVSTALPGVTYLSDLLKPIDVKRQTGFSDQDLPQPFRTGKSYAHVPHELLAPDGYPSTGNWLHPACKFAVLGPDPTSGKGRLVQRALDQYREQGFENVPEPLPRVVKVKASGKENTYVNIVLIAESHKC